MRPEWNGKGLWPHLINKFDDGAVVLVDCIEVCAECTCRARDFKFVRDHNGSLHGVPEHNSEDEKGPLPHLIHFFDSPGQVDLFFGGHCCSSHCQWRYGRLRSSDGLRQALRERDLLFVRDQGVVVFSCSLSSVNVEVAVEIPEVL